MTGGQTERADDDNGTLVAELVDRARKGDQVAWDALVERFTPMLWGIARRHRLSASDAADVVQTSWLRCVEHIDRIRESAFLASWLITTCRRECVRTLTAARRFVPGDIDDWVGLPARLLPDNGGDDPAHKVLAQERDAALHAAIVRLPQRQRQVVMAVMEADGCEGTYAHAAAAMGVPIGSLGPTRGRALRRLRRDPCLARLHQVLS